MLASQSIGGLLSFSRTSVAKYFDSAGTLQQASSGSPRFDYDPASLAIRGLLIEGSRTNICLQSENLSSGSWGKTAASISADAVAAPDGATTADKIVEDSSTGSHFAGQTVTLTANTRYTYSIFLKAAERSKVHLQAGKSGTPFTRGGMVVDLSNGTFVNSDSGTPSAVENRLIEQLPNGWYRVSMTVLIDATSTDGYMELRLHNGTSTSYTGDGTSGLYAWGAQIESGVNLSSYIVTTTVSATRSADVFTMTVSDAMLNASGTMIFYGMTRDASLGTVLNRNQWQLDDGGGNNRHLARHDTGSTGIRSYTLLGGAQQAAQTNSSVSAFTQYKHAYTFGANNFVSVLNGGAPQTDTAGSMPTGIVTLRLGKSTTTEEMYGWVRRNTYYRRALSVLRMQELTR